MTFASAPSPASSVSTRTLPRAEPKPAMTQSRWPSRATSARSEPKIHERSLRSCAQTKRRPRVLAHDQLDRGVQQRLAVGRAGEVLLPDLGLGALLQHDQHAAVQRHPRGVGDRGREHGRGDAHAARDVYERAAGPVGVVAGDELVTRSAATIRPRCGSTSSGCCATARREREHEHALRPRARLVDGEAVDLAERQRALGRLQQRVGALDGARVALARAGGREGPEVERAELGELPAGWPLNCGRSSAAARAADFSRRAASQAGSRTATLSQLSPPSGARSGGSSRPRTPSGAP